MEQPREYYVYAYLRSKDSVNGPKGSPYYIGKGKRYRANNQEHSVSLPADKSNIVFLAENLTEAGSHQAEMLLIQLHGRIDLDTGCLRNRTDGGEGTSGWIPSEQTRVKWKESATGHEVTEETKKKISRALTGKKLGPRNWTEEQRTRFSESRKGTRPVWLDDPDWKEKQTKLNQSDEHRNKIRESMTKYWSSEEGLKRKVSR